MHGAATTTEVDILADVLATPKAAFTPEAARSILALKFSKEANRQVRQLLRKNNRGTITADERVLLERYVRVGRFLDLLRAKAQLALQPSSDAR